MPDISGFQALDVAIGLAFVYFVFSMLASGVNEAIASVFALQRGTSSEGCGHARAPARRAAVGQVVNHPLVRSLVRDANTVADTGKLKKRSKPWRRPLPSYLPSRMFSLALLDTLAPPDGARDRRMLYSAESGAGGAKSSGQAAAGRRGRRRVAGRRRGEDHAQLRASIENWFDDTMDRVSGWYKRRITIIS